MSKNVWRILSVFVWVLSLVSILTMFQQVKENYIEYLSVGVVNGEIKYIVPALIIVIVIIIAYVIFLTFVGTAIWKKKSSTKKLLLYSIGFLTIKFIVQAYLKGIVGQGLFESDDLLDKLYVMFGYLDKNTNFLYMYSPYSNYFAPNTVLATEVIPISFMFLGLFLGWSNKTYFVIVSTIVVFLILFISFSTMRYNQFYFDLTGVYSTLSIGLLIVSYSLNSVFTSEQYDGIAI